MAELIREDDTLNQGRKKLNNAIKAFNETVVEGDSSVEAAQARVDKDGKTYGTLKERLDTEHGIVTSQLAEKANKEEVNQLADDKADITYVDNKIDSLDGLQIKGVFPTITALETAYPKGESGLYMVESDNHWYYWNGTEWKKGKQISVIDDYSVEIAREMAVTVQPNEYLVVADKALIRKDKFNYAVRTEQGALYKTQLQWYTHQDDIGSGTAIAIGSLHDLDEGNTPLFTSDKRHVRGSAIFLRLRNLSSLPREYTVVLWGVS